MKRAFSLTFAVAGAACSSWNTGSPPDDAGERACLDVCEAIARASERCGLEYARAYDKTIREVANGDCKNVISVRDDVGLRSTCIPSLRTESCTKVLTGEHDPSCSRQLLRPANQMAL